MNKRFVIVGAATLWLATMLWMQRIDASDNTTEATPTVSAREDSYTTRLHRTGQIGPAQISMHDQAILDLPQGFAFIPEEPAKKMMQEWENKTDKDFIGLILPEKESSWAIEVGYVPSGYIKDDDAKTWDADKLLSDIRENTEESNKRRSEQGIAPLEVVGWVEKPHYDEATHRLIWSIVARDKGSTDDRKNLINYRTLMLGREGYISMILITDLASIEGQKPIANLLLSRLNFSNGKKYLDFNSATDHVAEYGLAALVAGVAAKKLGLFAIAAAFIAKFAKVGIIAIVAFLAALRKKFSRKKS
jgi:uncharacterized membrane-anchored protein